MFVAHRIQQLPLYDDGLQCRLDPGRCAYVARDAQVMKKHWRQQHGWTAGEGRGGSGRAKQEAMQRRFHEGAKKVQCQRFFHSRAHSRYFEVRVEEQADAQDGVKSSADIWEGAWQQASQYYDERRDDGVIQPGEADEVNPWLRRTGWIQYLEGCESQRLLQSIQKPAAEDTPGSKGEPVAAVIWDAVSQMVTVSQGTVAESGVMLRFEAVRTEKEQVRYQPLEVYRDRASVQEQCRPWQQMIMFFVRTQQRHEWKSPEYRFNQRQQQAFDQLIDAAEQCVDSDSDSNSNSDSNSEDGKSSNEGNVTDNTSGRQCMTAIQKACLTFCIELLNQTMYSRESDMALVCALAIIGVNPKGTGFHSTKSFPSKLSAIIKISHFMVVQQAHEVAESIRQEAWSRTSSPCEFEDSGYESERTSRPRRPRSSFEWVKKMMNSFMVRGTGSPMQWMLDLRAYGMKVDFNTTSDGHVGWKDGDVLQYKDIHFSMADFRGMAEQLQISTRKKLLSVMFATDESEMPAVPWTELFDDPSNASVGWSFIDDTRTRWPVDGKEWLFQRIQSRPEERKRFVKEEAANGINKGRVRDWLKEIDDFRGQLLALMHITGGQPARGPEILSVRHSNTMQGGHRNLFIEDGMVVFVTQYHKGEQYHGDVKIIHRYLPREVGELVVWYRWLVLPFVQRIKGWLWSQPQISDHLWGPDVDGRKWTTERLKEHLQRATEAGLGHAIHVAAYRHIAIAISRRWVRPNSAFSDDVEVRDEEEISDEQATHSPFTAGAVYAREMDELPGSMASRRQQFRTASIDWHRFLGFGSSIKDEVQRGLKRSGDPFRIHSKRAKVERHERVRHMDVAEEMTWMMRKEMTLRSVQPEVFAAIQRGDSKIVAVMPTGAGKSMLFMLPAFVAAGGVTVVVVPFTTLRHDMKVRCDELNISVGEWDGKKSMDSKSIVFVTPEAAIQQGFQTFLRRIRQTEQLDRIVIDECHTMLGEKGGFRENIQRLGQLASAHAPMLLVTATLPPSEEGQLLSRMFWRAEETTVIRASTVRRNIEYSVVDREDGSEERMEQLARFIQPVVHFGGKAVVLCNNISHIRSMVEAAAFPCEPFHKEMGEQARKDVFEGFRAGRVRVLIATSVFGTGIDVPDIRLFIHVTMPDNLREYGQESGRCGRDGQFSRAIIVRGAWPGQDARVKAYVDGQGCRRVQLDEYLDGDATRTQCQEGEAVCDRCSIARQDRTPVPGLVSTAPRQQPATPDKFVESSTLVVAGRSSPERRFERREREQAQADERRVEQARDRQAWYSKLRDRLFQWKNVCVVCYQRGDASGHPISRCQHADGKRAECERKRAHREIRYPDMHVCFRCGVPRVMCDRWSNDGRARAYEANGKERVCQFYGVLVGVIYGIKYGYPNVWRKWVKIAEREAGWNGSMEGYLGQAIEAEEEYGCQVGRAFVWLTDWVREEEQG